MIDYAIDRLEESVAWINDPLRRCSSLFDRARTIHLTAAKKVRPDQLQLARTLFEREHGSGHWAFRDVLRAYTPLLGDPGLAEYRRLAEEAWAALPPLSVGEKGQSPRFRYGSLFAVLDHLASVDGDVEKRISLRTKDLSTAWAYSVLVEFCKQQGCTDLALEWVGAGLHTFADRPHVGFSLTGARLLAEHGRRVDALDWLKATLDRTEFHERGISDLASLCNELCELGGAATFDWVVARIERHVEEAALKPRIQWSGFLLEFLSGRNKVEAAYFAALRFDAPWRIKRMVAGRL